MDTLPVELAAAPDVASGFGLDRADASSASPPSSCWAGLCGRLFPSITTATDQHIGGIVAWILGAKMSAISFLVVLNNLRLYEASLPPEEFDDDDESPARIVVYASSWTGR